MEGYLRRYFFPETVDMFLEKIIELGIGYAPKVERTPENRPFQFTAGAIVNSRQID